MKNRTSPLQIGPYQLLTEIGRGGMGIVYRARDSRNGSLVALKVLSPNLSQYQTFVHNFWNEYRALLGLRHPNIVQVYDFAQDQGLYYIAAEYIQGGSLEHRLAQNWRPNMRTAQHIIRQVAAALDAAHQRGIVHCDLKPANILLDRRNRVVLTDFGIAHLLRTSQRGPLHTSGGTPAYMAPEQIQGNQPVNHWVDIYSLGVLTYRLLTGHLPFEREVDAAVLHAHVYDTPPPLRVWRPNLSPEIERVVLWSLSKIPQQRPRTAGEFIQHLWPAASGRWSLDVRPLRPTRLIATAGGALALLVVFVLWVVFGAQSNTAPSQQTRSGAFVSVAYTCEDPNSARLSLCLEGVENQRTILSFDEEKSWGANWAPDGERLAFVSQKEGHLDIWILDTTDWHAFGLIESKFEDTSPSWSPQGDYIAFDSDRKGNQDVFVYSFQDANTIQRTFTPYQDSDPAWSPTGQHIAFVSERDGDLEIYVMDADGDDQKRLTRHAGWDFGPAWSPDGERIAYECEMGNYSQICAMDADGRNGRQLTYDEVNHRHPAWSPDGSWIAYSRQRESDGRWDIWIMQPDGSEQQVWIQNERSNTQPAWRPQIDRGKRP